jgi:hypothetical protein
VIEPRRPQSLTVWWDQNRKWAQPLGCLALLLPALSIASCAGAVATFVFGAVKVGTSLRKRE